MMLVLPTDIPEEPLDIAFYRLYPMSNIFISAIRENSAQRF